MSTEYRVAEATAVVSRPGELTLLALDGRLDPQPVVIKGSGVFICDALQSWSTFDEVVQFVGARFETAATDEIEAGVRGFVDGLLDLGVVVTRESARIADDSEHVGA